MAWGVKRVGRGSAVQLSVELVQGPGPGQVGGQVASSMAVRLGAAQAGRGPGAAGPPGCPGRPASGPALGWGQAAMRGPGGAGARFCRNLRIRTDPTPHHPLYT